MIIDKDADDGNKPKVGCLMIERGVRGAASCDMFELIIQNNTKYEFFFISAVLIYITQHVVTTHRVMTQKCTRHDLNFGLNLTSFT